jgi:hypothetical protein
MILIFFKLMFMIMVILVCALTGFAGAIFCFNQLDDDPSWKDVTWFLLGLFCVSFALASALFPIFYFAKTGG